MIYSEIGCPFEDVATGGSPARLVADGPDSILISMPWDGISMHSSIGGPSADE